MHAYSVFTQQKKGKKEKTNFQAMPDGGGKGYNVLVDDVREKEEEKYSDFARDRWMIGRTKIQAPTPPLPPPLLNPVFSPRKLCILDV